MSFEHQEELIKLRSRLGSNIVIADIGAADGLDSVQYAEFFIGATIHSFEPEKKNFDALVVNTKMYGQVFPYNFALGDKDILNATFYVSDGYPDDRKLEENRGSKSSSLLVPKAHLEKWPWISFEKYSTSVFRFDSLDIPKVDYIHMDVQGYELKVLAGFGKKLSAVTAVWMEVSRESLYADQPLYDDVKKFMCDSGFVLRKDAVLGSFTGNHYYERP